MRTSHLCPPTSLGWSQEPPDSFLWSQNIPFASGVSEFPKPESWACPSRSLPLPTPSPPPLSPQPWARATSAFLSPAGLWAFPRGPGWVSRGQLVALRSQARGSGVVWPQQRVSQSLPRLPSPSPYLSKSAPSPPAWDSTLRGILSGPGLEECCFLGPCSSCFRVQKKSALGPSPPPQPQGFSSESGDLTESHACSPGPGPSGECRFYR